VAGGWKVEEGVICKLYIDSGEGASLSPRCPKKRVMGGRRSVLQTAPSGEPRTLRLRAEGHIKLVSNLTNTAVLMVVGVRILAHFESEGVITALRVPRVRCQPGVFERAPVRTTTYVYAHPLEVVVSFGYWGEAIGHPLALCGRSYAGSWI
jgi:hypothetical protein